MSSFARFGYTDEELTRLYRKISEFTTVSPVVLRATFALLKQNLLWEVLPGSVDIDLTHGHLERLVMSFLYTVNWTPDESIRWREGNRCRVDECVHGLVDVFPVFMRQDKAHTLYSGKYDDSCIKFECWITCDFVPFAVYGPFDGRDHDAKIMMTGRKFAHFDDELFIGDLGYMGRDHIATPIKKRPRQELTQDAQISNAYHRIYRTLVERFFSRLKRFRILQRSQHKVRFTAAATRFLVWCESVILSGVTAEMRKEVVTSGNRCLRCTLGANESE